MSTTYGRTNAHQTSFIIMKLQWLRFSSFHFISRDHHIHQIQNLLQSNGHVYWVPKLVTIKSLHLGKQGIPFQSDTRLPGTLWLGRQDLRWDFLVGDQSYGGGKFAQPLGRGNHVVIEHNNHVDNSSGHHTKVLFRTTSQQLDHSL